jgi:bifunctional non-homologous end joining protein LigD
MLATAGDVPAGPGYGFEFKWDGMRVMLSVAGRQLRVLTRNGKEVAASFPELAALTDLLRGNAVTLDGELVALDPNGVPQFTRLQQRMHVATPPAEMVAATPVRFFAFDVAYLDRPAMSLAYRDRRDLLESLELRHPVIDVPPSFTEVSGPQMLEVARGNRLEGVVAKRLDSRYAPGTRSQDWIKTALFATAEIVLGGWTPGGGNRAGSIGSLLMGMYDPAGALRHVGNVGTGFSQQELQMLLDRFAPLGQPTCPFEPPPPAMYARQARWLVPELVGEVVYRNWTADDRLRHTTWRGLRPDRNPQDICLPETR